MGEGERRRPKTGEMPGGNPEEAEKARIAEDLYQLVERTTKLFFEDVSNIMREAGKPEEFRSTMANLMGLQHDWSNALLRAAGLTNDEYNVWRLKHHPDFSDMDRKYDA